MSTYLVALVVAKLECKKETYQSKRPDGSQVDITVRSCARPNAKDELELAQEAAMKQIEAFEQYYQVPYPLEKLGIFN